AGGRHGKIAMWVGHLWLRFLETDPLGEVFGADTGFILSRNPDTILAPDVAFVRSDRLPPDEEQEGFLRLAPDLAVEVVSPSEREGDRLPRCWRSDALVDRPKASDRHRLGTRSHCTHSHSQRQPGRRRRAPRL